MWFERQGRHVQLSIEHVAVAGIKDTHYQADMAEAGHPSAGINTLEAIQQKWRGEWNRGERAYK